MSRLTKKIDWTIEEYLEALFEDEEAMAALADSELSICNHCAAVEDDGDLIVPFNSKRNDDLCIRIPCARCTSRGGSEH